MEGSGKYVIISPGRNEAKYMRQTLDSVIAQTHPPFLWIIVDDGSIDETPEILAEYSEQYDFIQVVRRDDRGHRAVGPGVIEAFYAGLDMIELDQYEFICKLDMDLVIPPPYFEIMIQRMGMNPRIGTCSGKPYYWANNLKDLISEGCGDESSIGAAKFYRITCFRQIGGFVRQVMWDGDRCS